MTKNQYKYSRLAIIFLLAFTLSWANNIKNLSLSVAAILLAILLMINLRKRVKALIHDERDKINGQRAISLSYTVFIFVGAMLSVILAGSSIENETLKTVGLTMAYSVCGVMLMTNLIYIYLQKTGK